jgi:hypothetical protein
MHHQRHVFEVTIFTIAMIQPCKNAQHFNVALRAHPFKIAIELAKILRHWQACFFGWLPITYCKINHLLFIPLNIGIF